MELVFNERKAAQAAAQLLLRHGKPMPYIVLIKLLYLADRRSLVETGYPLTGDRMVSMPYGPVLSRVLDTISNAAIPQFHAEHRSWFDYISGPTGYDVSLMSGDPASDELSVYELKLLETIHAEFGKMDKWDLVEFTHSLPEWRDPKGSSLPIDPEEILRAEGRGTAEISQIVAGAEEFWRLSEALAQAAK